MEFARVLTAGDWRVALLQEAPPRWLEPLCRRCGASGALALTSRNFLPHVRTTLARLNPDLIASNEGGSNMVLVRAPWRLEDKERFVLATRPERRTSAAGTGRRPVRQAGGAGQHAPLRPEHGPRPRRGDQGGRARASVRQRRPADLRRRSQPPAAPARGGVRGAAGALRPGGADSAAGDRSPAVRGPRHHRAAARAAGLRARGPRDPTDCASGFPITLPSLRCSA